MIYKKEILVKKIISCSSVIFAIILYDVSATASCDKNTISYMNCNTGQLIDICNDYAFWRVKEDCCIDTSPYIIRTEKIQKENSDFYAPYMTHFDKEVYHCLLKKN